MEQGVPPEKVNDRLPGKRPAMARSASPRRCCRSYKIDDARAVQRQRVADHYPGADAYYSVVLTLFGQGWDQHRFRFSAGGELQPDWGQECASSH